MSNYKIHPGTLFDYTAGVYCGVIVTENVMKKLAKLQAKHLEDVRHILHDEAERGNVYPSNWTLHHPERVQTMVNFIDTSADVNQRIKSATTAKPPTALKTVFIASDMDDAKQMADARYAELSEAFK